MIEIHDLSKRYGRRPALEDVTLTIGRGEITLLLGANGAGKSTLLRCLLGITSFDGSIRVSGLDPRRDGPSVRAAIGYMPQSGGLHLDLTVNETAALYAGIRRVPVERAARLLEEAGLTGHLTTKVGELSGGMRQRLGFAIALLSDPDVLVLDEPTASLDASSRSWMAGRLRALADEGRAIVVSTHGGQELIAVGDRSITLEDGCVVEDAGVVEDVGRADLWRAEDPRRAENRRALRTGAVSPIIRKELRDALRSRWLVGYAVLLAALGLAATASGLDSTSGLALQAFGRTTATLMNLCLLLSPLVAVLMGAGAIAGELERGTLEHVLAQPLSRPRLLFGKFAGLLTALTAATVAGFLPAGVLIASAAGVSTMAPYLLFPAIAALVGAAMAAIGLLISVTSRSAAQAQGTAVFTWFGFVLLYDLVLIGLLSVSGIGTEWLAVMLLANPVDAARVLGVLALEPDLYLLGPAGAYLTTRWSPEAAAITLLAALMLWTLIPALAAAVTFSAPVKTRKAGAGFARPAHRRSSDETKWIGAGLSRRVDARERVHVERNAVGIDG